MKKNGVMLVGLCGRSGSGKGYVSALFSRRGIPSVDTDAVYRAMTGPADALSPCMIELRARFGDAVVLEDGSLNRAAMRALVFGGDAEALCDLNRITHHYILDETRRIADMLCAAGSPIVLVDAPLLYESGFDAECARVVCVTAPEETIVARIMQRDGIGEADARRRLAAQKSVEELEGRADYVIVNDDCPKDELIRRVDAVADALEEVRRAEYEDGEACACTDCKPDQEPEENADAEEDR